jgi:hypothetical protein
MAGKAVPSNVSLCMAVNAEPHVNGLNRFDTIHRLHGTMAGLTGDVRVNVNSMAEPDEGRQYVYPVPTNFER